MVLEMDKFEIVDLWSARDNSRSIAMPIIREIGEIALSFSSFSVIHVSRAANGSAHLCARRARVLDVSESWLDVSPDFLVSALQAECNQVILP